MHTSAPPPCIVVRMFAWVLAMWIIAAVMGCWSFSLFVRSISELLARRRVHLTARRSGRAIVLALCLMVVCGAVSVFAGLMAVHLERQFTYSRDRWTTPLAVIGASVCLFALLLIICAIVGDRSRGRKRCPKCWYDMSGSPGLQCPECGKTAKSERKLSKSRRPRWAFVLALLMVVPGIYAMVVSKRVAEYGAFAAVPTWFLMAGWEHLPEGWIYDNGTGSQEYCLENRLSTDWVSSSRLHHFGRELTQPLLDSRKARWDERRISLIWRLDTKLSVFYREVEEEYISTAPPIDPEFLLLLSAEDIMDAIQGTSITPEDAKAVLSYSAHTSSYDLASGWIYERILGEYDSEDNPENLRDLIHERVHEEHLRILRPFQSRLIDERIGRAIASNDPTISNLMRYFSNDAEIMQKHLDLLLSSANDPDMTSWQRRAMRVGVVSSSFSAEDRARLFRHLITLLQSEGTNDRALACRTLIGATLIRQQDDQTIDDLYQQTVQHVIDDCVGDQSVFIDEQTQEEVSVHSLALQLLVQHDTTGERIFPLICEQLMLTGDAHDTNRGPLYGDRHSSQRDTSLWIETFGSFASSPDPEIREWVGYSIPHRTCTAADAELNLIALSLAMDNIESVADAGRHALEMREASHLLWTPDEDD